MLEDFQTIAQKHWRSVVITFVLHLIFQISWRRFGISLVLFCVYHGIVEYLEYREALRQFKRQDSLPDSVYTHENLGLGAKLKVIRLIQLHPAKSHNDKIQITFQNASLLDPNRPHYEAISYTWGDESISEYIVCEGSVMRITTNLFAALRRFRLKDKVRVLWADAISINQTDNEEKSWQVRMMKDVYAGADRVLIWLGEEAHDSELLEEFVPCLLDAKKLHEAAEDQRHFFQMDSQLRDLYGLPSIRDPSYSALLQINARSWFERVWIIQEIAMAKEAELICGGWSMPYEDFFEATSFAFETLKIHIPFMLLGSGSSRGRVSKLLWERHSISNGLSQTIFQLLAHHREAKAGRSVDKIFALAGLASDGAQKVEIDYDKSVTQVYRDIAFAIMMNEQNLDILSFCGHQPGINDLRFPSWVPDWRSDEIQFPLAIRNVLGSPMLDFQATRGSKCSPAVGKEDTLGLPGYSIDEVAITSHTMRFRSAKTTFTEIWDQLDFTLTYGEWDRICEGHSGKVYAPTGESTYDVFWQCLLVGQHEDSFEQQRREFEYHDHTWSRMKLLNSLPIASRWPPFKLLYGVVSVLLSLDWMLDVLCGRARDENFSQKMLSVYGRRMIKTRNGFIGMATGDAKVGDSVVFLQGGSVPFVVRKMADGSKNHILVGDCYLHGRMNGESWDLDRCETMWFR